MTLNEVPYQPGPTLWKSLRPAPSFHRGCRALWNFSELNCVRNDVAGVVRLIAHERGQEQVTAAPSAAKAAHQNDDENRADVEQRRAQQLERLEMLRYLRILPAKSLQTRVRYHSWHFERESWLRVLIRTNSVIALGPCVSCIFTSS